jgi:hypothetical protein
MSHGDNHDIRCNTQARNTDTQPTMFNAKEADGAKKIDVSLVPPASSREMALALMAGKLKPGRWAYNWRRGGAVKRRTYLAAAIRHIQADLDGEDLDKEMTEILGRPVTHLGAALASLGILADAAEFGKIIDDRPSSTYDREQMLAKEWAESSQKPPLGVATPHSQGGQSLQEGTALARKYWPPSVSPDAKAALAPRPEPHMGLLSEAKLWDYGRTR